MGRTRKTQTPVETGVDNLITNPEAYQEVKKDQVELDSVGLAITKTKGGMYQLVRIRFSLESGESEIEILTEPDGRGIIEERFKLAAAREILS